jgi:hypothetical protein
MDNNKNQQRSESQEVQQQNVNPDRLSASDEQQRTTARDRKEEQQQQTPVGNEQNSQDTQGAQAGVGE